MKKHILFFMSIIVCEFSFSQGISIGEIGQNLKLKPINALKDLNSIDSTFIYTLDTLSLPFFDDFSSNKFQEYTPNFNGPGISSQL